MMRLRRNFIPPVRMEAIHGHVRFVGLGNCILKRREQVALWDAAIILNVVIPAKSVVTSKTVAIKFWDKMARMT